MIWSLVREQVRSQRRYLVSAAIVIAVTVGLAAYGAIMTLTLSHTQSEIDHLMGYDRETVADASTATGFVFENLAPSIDSANADGHEVVAVANAWLTLPDEDAWAYNDLVALYGDVDWSTILIEGAAPQSGQIAVNAQWASEHGVELGDDLDPAIAAIDGNGSPSKVPLTLTVSGITRSPVGTAGVQIYVPSGFVAWEDVPVLNQVFYDSTIAETVPDADGDAPVGVTISGNGDWPWNLALATSANPYGYSNNPPAAIAIIAGIGVGALLIGLVAMAFALGRAQAQARVKWLGTVRALGATKRQVAAASLLESAAIGATAGAAGYVLGVLAAAAHAAIIGGRVASPMIVRAPAGYVAVAVGALMLATLLALIVGAVPAFWAARVEPTAALKPVNDLSEATVSRHVTTWPLAAAWLASLVVSACGAIFGAEGFAVFPVVIAAVSLLVTSLMLAHEVLRRSLPWHARHMSRSARRPAMVAGDAILARPRQSTIPAFIVALATTIVVGLFAQLVVAWAISDAESGAVEFPNPYISPLLVGGVFVVVTFLCVVIAAATASVTSREAATREALGLSRSEGRAAAALQYLVAQTHGLALGLVGGLIAAAFMIPSGYSSAYSEFAIWWQDLLGLLALVIATAASCALVGATVAALAAPKTAPLSRVEVAA